MQNGFKRVTSAEFQEAVQAPLVGTVRRKRLVRNEEALMKRHLVRAVAGAIVVLAFAAQAAEAPIASIEIEYLGRLKITTDAQMVAPSIVYPATECSFAGPKLRATCVARLIAEPNGPSRLEIRATLKTDAGDVIFMDEGIVDFTQDAVDRNKEGGTLPSKDECVANAPRFITTSKGYSWLNDVQTLAKRVGNSPGQIEYDLFVVR
jgi:Protein of unknown function (DUF3237)